MNLFGEFLVYGLLQLSVSKGSLDITKIVNAFYTQTFWPTFVGVTKMDAFSSASGQFRYYKCSEKDFHRLHYKCTHILIYCKQPIFFLDGSYKQSIQRMANRTKIYF